MTYTKASGTRIGRCKNSLCATLAKHLAMLQVAGEGEASSVKMKELIEGLGSGTKWEREYTTGAEWRKTLTLSRSNKSCAGKVQQGSSCRMAIIQEYY